VLVGVAALCGSALPAHASVGLDHGSTVEAGCGAYYSATPDPATTSDQLTLTLSFACTQYQFVTYPEADLYVGPGASHGGQAVILPLQQVSPTSCSTGLDGSVTCVFPPQPPGVYTAAFYWGLGEGGTGSIGRPGDKCWQWPEGGYSCWATLEVVVT